jgi:hypothetical protein
MVYVPQQFVPWVDEAANQLGIPSAIVAAQISQESGFNNDSVGQFGERGIVQFTPDTWKEYGGGNDPTNYQYQLEAYVKYMKHLLDLEGGNIQMALAAYNGGPGNPQAGMNYANTILNSAGLPNLKTRTTDNSGVSLGNSNVFNYVADNNPVMSLAMLKSEYPLVAALVSSVPELNNIYSQAVDGTWSTDKFIAAIQNSRWWSTHSDTARQAFALMKTDPATWGQNIDNLEATMKSLATQLGANITPQQAQQFAVEAIQGGYEQNQAVLNEKLSQFVKPVSGNHFGGTAGSYEDQIRQSMRELGVFMPEDQLDAQIQQIIAGKQSVNGVTGQLRTQAASLYPAYANQINSGMNVSDIASPFISRAQQLLEQGPGQMNIQSPLIKSALQYTQDGQPTAMPMYDFEKSVRQDPRWLSTNNAQDQFMSNAHKILVDFGFEY